MNIILKTSPKCFNLEFLKKPLRDSMLLFFLQPPFPLLPQKIPLGELYSRSLLRSPLTLPAVEFCCIFSSATSKRGARRVAPPLVEE